MKFQRDQVLRRHTNDFFVSFRLNRLTSDEKVFCHELKISLIFDCFVTESNSGFRIVFKRYPELRQWFFFLLDSKIVPQHISSKLFTEIKFACFRIFNEGVVDPTALFSRILMFKKIIVRILS